MTRVPREREPRQFRLASNDAAIGNDHASALLPLERNIVIARISATGWGLRASWRRSGVDDRCGI